MTPYEHAERVLCRPPPADLLALLRMKYPWPAARPDKPVDFCEVWFDERHRRALRPLLRPDARLVIELGSWMGRSATWFAAACPRATVVCVDHWRGSPEYLTFVPNLIERLPRLYEQFCANVWPSRGRIIPVRADSLSGMRACAGLEPDLVYVDAGHDAASVKADVETAVAMFPDAAIAGDDVNRAGVRDGLALTGLAYREEGPVWWLV
jgi:hypothetical protein